MRQRTCFAQAGPLRFHKGPRWPVGHGFYPEGQAGAEDDPRGGRLWRRLASKSPSASRHQRSFGLAGAKWGVLPRLVCPTRACDHRLAVRRALSERPLCSWGHGHVSRKERFAATLSRRQRTPPRPSPPAFTGRAKLNAGVRLGGRELLTLVLAHLARQFVLCRESRSLGSRGGLWSGDDRSRSPCGVPTCSES